MRIPINPSTNVCLEEHSNSPHYRAQITVPSLKLRLYPDEARLLADHLLEAAGFAESIGDLGHEPSDVARLSMIAAAIKRRETAPMSEQLAKEFSRVLREWLTHEQMDEVIARNADEPDKLICHSHDFCDANMAMDQAFTKVMGRQFVHESDTDLWNTAWDIAKKNQFDS